ncbi:Flp family type IVb pilin [Palleronia sp. KMU-117]|uniref:Flp family type IVb pilin n=1 Tax=Palleronia sp. KMU-117 TaxID=3434108 RepID=UPI003D72FDBC
MRNAVIKTWNRLLGNEEGLTLVEYGVGAILAVTVGAVALTQLGAQINNELGQAEGVMEATGGTVGTAGLGTQ